MPPVKGSKIAAALSFRPVILAVPGARTGTAEQVAQGRLQLRVTEPVAVTEQPPRADPLVCPG